MTNPLTIQANPKCDINIDVHNRRTPPLVKVTYADGVEQSFANNEVAGHKIVEEIQQKADEIMLDRQRAKEWRVEDTMDLISPELVDSIIKGKGRRHKPSRADRAALREVFAGDLAAARAEAYVKRRAESQALQDKLKGMGIDHF
eukprot:SAG22_NODE_1802_length_3535_cov_2.147846_2_plen_145_part_00